MKRDCPTIQELLAFDAVARHEGLTRAAEALCLTVSAVSKQIAGLEAFLGQPLLRKQGRGVQLTPQGRAYWQKIAGPLRALEAASYEARAGGGDAGVVTLASVPTFLTRWLIPRLPAFSRRHPQVTLGFSRHLAPTENLPPQVDAAIRYSPAELPGVVAEYIAGANSCPSPRLRCCRGPTAFMHRPTCWATPCCITRRPPPPGRAGQASTAWPRGGWRPGRASPSIPR